MENWQAYQKAMDRVNARIGLYFHAGAYVVVNTLLAIVNFQITPGYLWFKWPLIGWGIGLSFHALAIFLFYGGTDIKERMIEEEIKKKGL